MFNYQESPFGAKPKCDVFHIMYLISVARQTNAFILSYTLRKQTELNSIHFKNQGEMYIKIVKTKCLSRLSISRESQLPLDLKRIQRYDVFLHI